MSRDLVTQTEEAATADLVRPFVLVELDYESGPVRWSTTPFKIEHNGDVFLGIGLLGSVSAVEEGAEIRSYGVSFKISGIPDTYFSIMAAERFQDRACRVWLGFLDREHRQLGVPVQIFGGRMDVLELERGQTITVTLTAESRLVDWERARIRRFTDQDQQRAYPGDIGLQFVQATTEMELIWGRG